MIQKILYYLNPTTLFKKNENNINTRMMHGMNRISIIMFVICIFVVLNKIFHFV